MINMTKKKHSKKAVSMVMAAIMTAAILAFAAFIVLSWYTPTFGKGIKDISSYLDDCDKDGVKDKLDSCPCDILEKGTQENKGCPPGYSVKGENRGREDKTCLEKECPYKTT